MNRRIATSTQETVHPVGKSYASIVDDEKTAFEQGRKHRQNRHKNPATSIVAAFADMGGRRKNLISVSYGSIILFSTFWGGVESGCIFQVWQ